MSSTVIYTSPLDWPISWTRSRQQVRSRFGHGQGTSVPYARDELLDELRLLGASEIHISMNLRLTRTGIIDGSAPEPADHGAAVYFRLKHESRVLACDKWDRVADNLYAISKHIDAIRGQVRWGVGSIEQSFGGYKMLTAMGAKRPWHIVLGLKPSATWAEVVAARTALLNKFHPDHGGDQSKASDVNAAFDEARTIFKKEE